MFNKFYKVRKTDKTHYSEEYNEFSFLMHQYDNLSESHNSQNEMLWSAPAMFLTAQSFLLLIALGALTDVEWWARAIAAFISCVFGFISIQKFKRDRLMVVSDAEQLLDIEKKMIKLGHPGMEINDKQIRRKYLNKELLEVKLKKDKIQTNFNSLSTIVFWEIGMWITTAVSLGIFLLTLILEAIGNIQNIDMPIIIIVFFGVLSNVILMILDYTFNPYKFSIKKGKAFKILLVLITGGITTIVYFASISNDCNIKILNTVLSFWVLIVEDIIYIFRLRKIRENKNKELKNIQTLILAGGDGTRLSGITKNRVPKFLAVMSNGSTLLENAISRNKDISGQVKVLSYRGYKAKIDENNKKDKKKFKRPLLKKKCFEYEECNRGTGTAIFNYIINLEKGKDPILVIVPSDHVILDVHSYQDDIKNICGLAKDFNYIYLIGIEPSYPATDYGYFEADEVVSYNITKARNFTEKPSLKEAEKWIKTGRYYWNSGIFIAKASVFQHEFDKYCFKEFSEYTGKKAYDKEAYLKSQVVSFDEYVLQRSDNIYALIGSFDWVDIGDPIRLQGAIKEDICKLNGNYFLKPSSVQKLIWYEWGRTMSFIIKHGSPVIKDTVYAYAHDENGLTEKSAYKMYDNHGGPPEKGKYKIKNDFLINLLYSALTDSAAGIKISGLGTEDFEVSADELKGIKMIIDQLHLISKYKAERIDFKDFTLAFKNQTLFYSARAGIKAKCLRSETKYYPVFLTEEHLKEYYKNQKRRAHTILQNNFEHFLSDLGNKKKLNKLGVAIEPGYKWSINIPPFFRNEKPSE